MSIFSKMKTVFHKAKFLGIDYERFIQRVEALERYANSTEEMPEPEETTQILFERMNDVIKEGSDFPKYFDAKKRYEHVLATREVHNDEVKKLKAKVEEYKPKFEEIIKDNVAIDQDELETYKNLLNSLEKYSYRDSATECFYLELKKYLENLPVIK